MSRYVLVGLDGCGKSTVLNMLKEDYSSYSFLWCRYKPKLVEKFYKMFNKGYYRDGKLISQTELDDKYKKKDSLKSKIFKSKIIRKIWLRITFFDYKSSFKKNYASLKNKKAVIFDRYYYDFFIDQLINYSESPEVILKHILKNKNRFPSIDKVFYIRVSPNVCYLRKNDIPNIEYLEKRLVIYDFLSKSLGWHVIDGEQPLESEYREIINQMRKENE